MKIPNSERWESWNEIKCLSVDIKHLGNIFQNEVELSEEEVLEWSRRVINVASKLASLNRKVLGRLTEGDTE